MRPGSTRVVTLLALAAVLAVALAVRLAFVRTVPQNLAYADEREYQALALEMQRSWDYVNDAGQPAVYWPPGYPYFLGAVYRVFGPSIAAARAVQAVTGAITCLLVYLIAGRLLRERRAAVLAAAFTSVYPLSVYTASTLYPAVLQTFLLACVIYLTILAKDLYRDRGASAAAMVAAPAAGLAGACSAFVGPSAVPALICAAAWLAWPAGPSFRRGLWSRLALAILLLAPLVIAVGAWSHRNSRDFGRPVAISANGGFNFWLGNHPDVTATTGNRMTPNMREELGAVYAEYRNPAVRDSVLFQMGLRYASSDPGRFVRLSAAKALNFWRLYPQPMTEVQTAEGKEKWLSLLSYGLLLPFGAVWLARSLGRSGGARLILLVLISYTLVHAAFISKVRFRVPVDPYILVYAAGAILAIVDALRARRGANETP